MKQAYFASALVISCVLWTLVVCESRQQQQAQAGYNAVQIKRQVSKRMAPQQRQKPEDSSKISDEQMKLNEIGGGENENDRITIAEPYKSIIQTTARFALAQTKLTKHVNIETAMNFLNDAGYFLSKPLVLLKALKVVAVTIATMLATMFFFPGAHKFAEAALNDPLDALNLDRYLTNGLQERSVLAALGSKTDETLSRVGLQDNSCRQRSLCYIGEILKCSFPHTSESITKFASDNFSSTSLKENVYARAFISGFVDRNCTGIGSLESGREAQHCLSNFISSILSGIENRSYSSKK